ncbi:MAG: hypothetical protein IPG63_10420 [Xanthomonadales bacterium]|nr:hypothetical protein [Xanthomonadales bacterium]
MVATAAQEKGRTLGDRVVWASVVALWLLPLVATQFSSEMDWSVFDFVVWALMLGSAAGLYHLATRLSGHRAHRAGAGIAVATGFLITWSNLAVGIIGNEDHPLNLMFFAVLGLSLLGALAVRFQARRMVHVMQATALAQAATAVVALLVDGTHIFVITAVLVALWLLSAAFFRKAARADEHAGGVG